MSTDVINISAQISVSLANRLEKAAKFYERPKSFYIKKSLEKYLDDVFEDMEDYRDAERAYKEFKKSGESSIPAEEIFKKSKIK